jgi:hypothetical protein
MTEKTGINPFKEGDILVSCWGHGQTNVDFFVVTRTTNKSVWLAPIKKQGVDKQGKVKEYTYKDGEGLCAPVQPTEISGTRCPSCNERIEKDSRKLVLGSGVDTPYVINPRHDFACAYRWNGKPVRESWYY